MSCQASMVADDYLDDDGECVEWREATVIARKAQRCHECLATIAKGERHETATGCVAGEGWNTWRRCAACAALAEMIATAMDLCIPWGALRSFCEDHQDDERHPWLNWNKWHATARKQAP